MGASRAWRWLLIPLGAPTRSRGRKTSTEWRAATWRMGPQWGICEGLGDLKPPHSLIRCLFFHVSRSVSSFLSLQLFRAVRVSHTALSFGPLTSYLPLFLPPLFLFFLSTPFSFSLYSPFNLFSISRCICALQVLGWTDKHWLGFGGVQRRRNVREEWGSDRAVSCFPCCSCDCRSVCALSVEVSHVLQQWWLLCRPAFFLSCCFNCCSRWRTTKPRDIYFHVQA